MTWEEWCNSEYNVDEFWCDTNYVRVGAISAIAGATPSGIILNGHEYFLAHIGGAG